MQVAEITGAPRMGPTFGAMLISGQKAAALAIKAVEEYVGPVQTTRAGDASSTMSV